MIRDNFWDSLKFLLIFLVVYGHMIETYSFEGSFNQAMYNFIYVFHMPLFIFISGRFSHVKDRVKYRKSLVRLLETYFVFQMIRCMKPLVYDPSLSFNLNLFLPKGTMWYLACLLIYRMFIYIMPSQILERYSLLIIMLGFSFGIAWGFIPISASQRTVAFFPFFMMGYYSVNIDWKRFCSIISPSFAIVTVLLFFSLLFFLFNYSIDCFVYMDRSYYQPSISYSSIYLFVARCTLYLLATTMSVLIMRLVLLRGVFPQLGSKTLFIYMYHTFIVLALRLLITKGYVMQDNILLFLYSIAIVVFLVFLSRFAFFTILLNPFSFIINKWKR